MSDVALTIKSLSKQYQIGVPNRHPMFREALAQAVSTALRRLMPGASNRRNGVDPAWIWALRDVSFEVKHGEVMGIIGRNGAGKSTLLKILSGVTEPTAGYADLYGRVGSLLEVGTGFHMELTGRENIFMNGALLGMRRDEIKRKFDEIVAFSEVEKFLDTPVKRYSSGMYMRLAFAVAAHLEPEILVVDEVLAVGDAAFQKKCLGKMSNVAREGRTVLFVSHNMSTIQALCQKTVWLDAGQVKEIGPTAQVVRKYFEMMAANEAAPLAERHDRTGDGSARIRSLQIQTVDGQSVIRTGSRLKLTLTYASDKPLLNPRIYASVYDLSHTGIYALDTDVVGGIPEVLPPTGSLTCVTDPIHLTPGRCYVNVGLLKGVAIADRVEYAAYFDVEADETGASGKTPRRNSVLCLLKHQWFLGEEKR
jgi:lipopolysaccharide transport system ATP-binding protein